MSNPSMSIAFINNFGGPTLGGGEVQLLALVRGLTTRGEFDLTVICAQDSALERECNTIGGVRVLPVSFAAVGLPRLPRRIAELVGRTDIVQGTGYLTNLLSRRVGARTGAAVVNAVHVVPGAAQLDGGSAAGQLARDLADRATRRKVDRFVAVSNAVAEGLEASGVDPTRITVVPNGVDADALAAEAATGDSQIRQRGSGPHVTYLGRLEPVKGCEYFIRAAALLRQTHPTARFLVAGAGSLEGDLRVLALALGVADRLDFLGYVESAAALLAASDIVVIPSLSESFGLTAAEALALGVPVVATAVGGLPDVVVDGETGLLVPAADAAAGAVAVARLLDDPEFARRLGEAGQLRVRERFGTDRMVVGYVGVYEELRAQ